VINAAIIGLGGWGRRLVDSVHGKSERIRFTSAVVRRPERVAEYAEAHGIAVGSDLDAVLADRSIDTVVVSSAAGVHGSQGLQVIRAGKPVMVIKPLALNSAEANELRDEAASRGQILALGYNRCFLPANAELRRVVAEGELGTPLHAEGNFCVDRYGSIDSDDWKADPEQTPPGGLTDHMLYEMIRILGPVAEVTARSGNRAGLPTLKDTTATLLRFENGATGLLTAIGTTADLLRLQVFGTKGWATVEGVGDFKLRRTDGKGEEKTFPKFDAERAELEALADAVEGKAAFPVTAEQAAHSVAVLEAIRKSAIGGGTVSLA